MFSSVAYTSYLGKMFEIFSHPMKNTMQLDVDQKDTDTKQPDLMFV